MFTSNLVLLFHLFFYCPQDNSKKMGGGIQKNILGTRCYLHLKGIRCYVLCAICYMLDPIWILGYRGLCNVVSARY